MLRDGNPAVVEFRKLVDRRGIVANFPLGALARIGLARLYTLQGDTARARAGYIDFFTQRKDADASRPHPEASQSGVREGAVISDLNPRNRRAGPKFTQRLVAKQKARVKGS